MIDEAQFKAVQRRVAILGRFNADPYNPDQWWVADQGLRSLLYRFKIGVADNVAANLYGLEAGLKGPNKAARRQKLYTVLRPMFRERTVDAILSGGALRMAFTIAEIPTQEDQPGQFSPGVIIDERSPLRNLTGSSGFDILDTLGNDLDTFLSFEASGGFDEVRLLFAAYCNQFPEKVAEDLRDGDLTADLARILVNVLMAPGPECVIPDADAQILLAASAGIPLAELIADFRSLALAENIAALQPGPGMNQHHPTPTPLGGNPNARIQNAVARIERDNLAEGEYEAKVERIAQREQAVTNGADILKRFRAARAGLNRIAQVLQSNLLLGAVASWILTDDQNFSTAKTAFDEETEKVFRRGILLAGQGQRDVPIRGAVLKAVESAKDNWGRENPAENDALAASTDALYQMGETRLLSQPEFRPEDIRKSGLADAGWLLTQAIVAATPAYREAAEKQSVAAGKELQDLLAEYAEFQYRLPQGTALPLIEAVPALPEGMPLRWTFSDKSGLKEVVLRSDRVSYRGRVTEAGLQELYGKAREADTELAAARNPNLRAILAEVSGDERQKNQRREAILTQFQAERPFTQAVHDTILQAEPVLPDAPPAEDESPEANEARVRANNSSERLKQTIAILMSKHRDLARQVHGENERLIGGFNRALPLMLEAAEKTGQTERPPASADLKTLTAAQGVPVAISTTALANRADPQRALGRLNVTVPANVPIATYHEGRRKVLARYAEMKRTNPGGEFVGRARRMTLAQIILHVNKRLPMFARPDLGNLAGLLHELTRHWEPASGTEDAAAVEIRKKKVREAFLGANPGGLTRFLPLVTLTDTREVARQYQQQTERSRHALRDLITDLRGLEYLVEELPAGSELLILNMTADDFVRVPAVGANFENRDWPDDFGSADSLQAGAAGSRIPLAVVVSRSAQRWGSEHDARLQSFVGELNKRLGQDPGNDVVPPIILAAETATTAEQSLAALNQVEAILAQQRPTLAYPIQVCGLTPILSVNQSPLAAPGMAPYFLAGYLLGNNDPREVAPNKKHPLPASAAALGFTVSSRQTVAQLMAKWALGEGRLTPGLGANLYAWLRSLQHRAEILGAAGTAINRIHVPDPNLDRPGFQSATTAFYSLFHHLDEQGRANLIAATSAKQRYYDEMIDWLKSAGLGFPLMQGAVFGYTDLAMPPGAPLPPPASTVSVSRAGGDPVAVLWLALLYGLTSAPLPPVKADAPNPAV